jgi:hypothetical protein
LKSDAPGRNRATTAQQNGEKILHALIKTIFFSHSAPLCEFLFFLCRCLQATVGIKQNVFDLHPYLKCLFLISQKYASPSPQMIKKIKLNISISLKHNERCNV